LPMALGFQLNAPIGIKVEVKMTNEATEKCTLHTGSAMEALCMNGSAYPPTVYKDLRIFPF